MQIVSHIQVLSEEILRYSSGGRVSPHGLASACVEKLAALPMSNCLQCPTPPPPWQEALSLEIKSLRLDLEAALRSVQSSLCVADEMPSAKPPETPRRGV